MYNFDKEVTKILNESRLQYEFDVEFNEVARQVENLFKWLMSEANIQGERIMNGVHFKMSQINNGPVNLEILNINLANDPVFGQYVDMIEKTQAQLQKKYGIDPE
tara:strand:- start:1854 stop:2168 length:315 start_codon:yes stop_codon:yes gene_type:complete